MNIHFILIEPSKPGNIGAAARAIKTMGGSSLRLVNPASSLDPMDLKMAYGSHDLLKSAKTFESLAHALADLEFSIATTAKKRTGYYEYSSPEQALEIATSKEIKSLGIVFGREDRGLENNEIKQCDMISTIQLANEYPSINLSQSVMIYAYIFKNREQKSNYSEAGDQQEHLVLKEAALRLFDKLEISKKKSLHRRMLERLLLVNKGDMHLLLSFNRFLTQKFNQFS